MDNITNITPMIKSKSYIMEEMKKLIDGGIPDGLRTDIKELDEIIRLKLGTFVVMTGYAGMGKSEFIDWLCYKYHIKYGYKTLYYSPENTTQLHMPKLISKFSGKTFKDLTKEERYNVLGYIIDNFYFFDERQEDYIENIITEAEYFIKENDIKIVVFEPFNSFFTKMSNGNLFELNTIRIILTRLRSLAINNNVLVILTAHPKKPTDNYQYATNDIAHSLDFKNRADYSLSIHKKKNDDVEINVDKVRDKNYGKVGKCTLSYDVASGNYYKNDEYNDVKYTHEPFQIPILPKSKDILDVDVGNSNEKEERLIQQNNNRTA